MKSVAGKREGIAFLEVVVAMTLAGSSVVPARVVGSDLPVFLTACITFCLAFAVALPLHLVKGRGLGSVRGRELLLMLLQALFGMVMFRIFLLYGLRLTSAVDAGVITGTGPAMTVLLGRLVFRESLTARHLAALLGSVAGIVCLNLGGIARGAAGAGGVLHSLPGDLLVLCAIASESLLTIFRKLSTAKVPAVTNTMMLSLLGALMTLAPALAGLLHAPRPHFTPIDSAALAYYGCFVTVGGYLLWGHAALRLPARSIGIATGAMPVSACLLSALLPGEHLGYAQCAGCALIVTSIALCVGRSRSERRRPTAEGRPHGATAAKPIQEN